MTTPENRPHPQTPQTISPEKETGVLTERVELPGPESDRKPLAPAESEEETLLPHERDQTTKPTGTSQSNENEMSRDVIEQAAEDTEHGLKDTDRRGIPSDIVATDVSAAERRRMKQTPDSTE